MSRPRWQLRDAALGYASRGIPVLPLHYPLPHRSGLQPVPGDRQPARGGTGCSCRDPGCGQPAKHPLGSLVPHGVKDATTNRARILAWWTRHPQANIGLATGHAFDVLDVDGPAGTHAIQDLAATHGFQSTGPLVRTGGGGWHFYLTPTGLGNASPAGLEHVDWRGRGGYVVAPPSRHASGQPYQWVAGRDLDTPPGQVPAVLLERLQPRQLQRPTGPVQLPAAADGPGDRYARAALAEELARVAAAPVGPAQPPAVGVDPQPLQPGRHRRPRPARGRPGAACGGRALRAAGRGAPPDPPHPGLGPPGRPGPPRPPRPAHQPRTHPGLAAARGRSANQPRRGGDGHGRRRPAGRLSRCSRGGRVPPPSRARAHPTTPQEGACMGSHPTLDQTSWPPRPSSSTPTTGPTRSRRRPPGRRPPPGPHLARRQPRPGARTGPPRLELRPPPPDPRAGRRAGLRPAQPRLRRPRRPLRPHRPPRRRPARGRPRPGRAGGRPRQPPERPRPGHLAARPGLPHGRRHPRRPHPAHPDPLGPERVGPER